MPVVDAADIILRGLQGGQQNALRIAELVQNQQAQRDSFARSDRNFDAEQEQRDFQRRRILDADARARAQEQSDQQLAQARMTLLAGLDGGPGMGGGGDGGLPGFGGGMVGVQGPPDPNGPRGMQVAGVGGVYGPPNPANAGAGQNVSMYDTLIQSGSRDDFLRGSPGGQGGIPPGFSGASPGAQNQYIGAAQHQQSLAALQQQLQKAVQAGIIQPEQAVTYIKLGAQDPRAIIQIQDDLRMNEQNMLKTAAVQEHRATRVQAITPFLQQMASTNPTIAGNIAILAKEYSEGTAPLSGFLAALTKMQLDEEQKDYMQNDAPRDLAAVKPNALPGTTEAAANLRRHNVPIGLGEANFSGRAKADKLDLSNDAEYQALALDVKDGEDELRAANQVGNDPAAATALEKVKTARDALRKHLRGLNGQRGVQGMIGGARAPATPDEATSRAAVRQAISEGIKDPAAIKARVQQILNGG